MSATVGGICVDTYGEALVHRQAGPLPAVAGDDGLAGEVRGRRFEEGPAKRLGILLGHRPVRRGHPVDEDVAVSLEVADAGCEEPPVRLGDKPGIGAAARRGVGGERPVAAEIHPGAELAEPLPGCEHQLLVVAQEGHEAGLVAQPDEPLHHPARVRPGVHEVSEDHEDIFRSGGNRIEQGRQGDVAAMDVADGQEAGKMLRCAQHDNRPELTSSPSALICVHLRQKRRCRYCAPRLMLS